MNYYNLFDNAFNKIVPTFTFKLKNGDDNLGFRRIAELTEEYVVLSDSVSSFRLYFDTLECKTILINDIEYPVVYSDSYFNYRFIPVEKHENNKYLTKLFSAKHEELMFMFTD